MASITLNHIDKTYDDGYHAIRDVNLDIEDGEFVILSWGPPAPASPPCCA